jgi:hypothetical protein
MPGTPGEQVAGKPSGSLSFDPLGLVRALFSPLPPFEALEPLMTRWRT